MPTCVQRAKEARELMSRARKICSELAEELPRGATSTLLISAAQGSAAAGQDHLREAIDWLRDEQEERVRRAV